MAVLSFFSGLRGLVSGTGNEIDQRWNVPDSVSELNKLFHSAPKPQLIYKHSFACGICVFSKSELESELDRILELADAHFIDVRTSRDISNKIEELTEVKHESPQAIILKNGEVAWHASHSAIKTDEVFKQLRIE